MRFRSISSPQFCRGLVDQVDRLVGQEPVRDIFIRKGGRRDDGRILDLHSMMDLVALLESAENGDGVLHARLVDKHRLETTFQRRILFNIFPILVQRRGTDAVQFSARQKRLQQISGVHRALSARARTDHGVQLINKEDDPSFRGGDLLQHGFQTLFEFATVFCSGDQRAHVERDQFLLLESFRHIAAHNPVGETFHNGGLSDAGFSDQNRIVFRSARKDLNGPADLVIPSDHGVELVLRGGRGQVASVLFEGLKRGLGRVVGHTLVSADRLERIENRVLIHSELLQKFSALAVHIDQSEEQMFHADIFILHVFGDLFCPDQSLAEIARRIALLSARSADRRHALQRLLNGKAQLAEINIHLFQKRRNQPALLIHQSLQQMNRTNLLMSVLRSDVLRCDHRLSGLCRQFFHIHIHRLLFYFFHTESLI